MNTLLKNISELAKLTVDEVEPILSLFSHVKVSSKAILLEPGSISQSAWFIGKGILRAYSIVEETKRSHTISDSETNAREITHWIVPEGGFLMDVRSFLHQIPATYFIETLESCSLYKLSYENYLVIQQSYPNIARLIFEHTLILADLRVQMCSLRAPLNKLTMFEKMYPGISGRLSVNIQASYLNIDRVTLSRLRGKNK